MGAVVGLVVGYVLGSRSTARRRAELRESWHVVKTSDEVRGLLATGITIAGGLVNRGSELLAGRLQSTGDQATLGRVA